MVDEKFVETPLPDDTKYCHGFLDQGSNKLYPTLYYLDDMIEHTRGMHVWVLKGYGPTGYWEKREYITLPDMVSFSLQMVLWKNRKIVFSNYADLDIITWYDLLTREMRSLHVPGDMSILGYTGSLMSIANFVRRPPQPPAAIAFRERRRQADNAPGGSLQPHQPQEEDEEVTSAETVLIPEENAANDEDEDDRLSTDSVFELPNGLSYLDPEADDVNYRNDKRFSLHRRLEWLRLAELTYCLHEVNQPIPPNVCTF
uniref:Uncharacterized protein n=1 Tax=Chenopodium quinoa TaxID=63459 RepID=A0A803KPT5_CHEQI